MIAAYDAAIEDGHAEAIILLNGRQYWSAADPSRVLTDMLELVIEENDDSYRRLNPVHGPG